MPPEFCTLIRSVRSFMNIQNLPDMEAVEAERARLSNAIRQQQAERFTNEEADAIAEAWAAGKRDAGQPKELATLPENARVEVLAKFAPQDRTFALVKGEGGDLAVLPEDDLNPDTR